MEVSNFKVSGLFGLFDHNIAFQPNERITIMVGPNGFGKTMMLRILNAIFSLRLRRLDRTPFQKAEVRFDNGSVLTVNRSHHKPGAKNGRSHRGLEITYMLPDGSCYDPFLLDSAFGDDDVSVPLGAIEDFIPEIEQIGPSEWMNYRTGEVLDLDDVISDYGDHFPGPIGTIEYPDWLEGVGNSTPVRYIDTERLTGIAHHRTGRPRFPRNRYRATPGRTIRRCSENLGHMIQRTLATYGAKSQGLDRSFPVRLVGAPNDVDISVEELQAKLSAVETKRSSIVEAGFIVQDLHALSMPDIGDVDDSRRGVLAVYAQDAMEKLEVFDYLYARVNTLKRIANERLMYKDVAVSAEGLQVIGDDGSALDLEMLSSGEQHELVLLYELLFETSENSLVMIDEPELSLHVSWQEAVLEDLQDMAYLSNFRVLLATHSPQIIGDRWDLAVELKGPDRS